jgi:hypothetical protein
LVRHKMSADTPQQRRASSTDAKKEVPATNGHHLPVGANGTARAAGRTDDTRKLKSENEHLLSELKAMKEQMQAVQSREKGITKAYLGVCRDLDHVSVPRPSTVALESACNLWALTCGVGRR